MRPKTCTHSWRSTRAPNGTGLQSLPMGPTTRQFVSGLARNEYEPPPPEDTSPTDEHSKAQCHFPQVRHGVGVGSLTSHSVPHLLATKYFRGPKRRNEKLRPVCTSVVISPPCALASVKVGLLFTGGAGRAAPVAGLDPYFEAYAKWVCTHNSHTFSTVECADSSDIIPR